MLVKSRGKYMVPTGATLVEVVITVGILVTVMIPLLGLLSAAIETSGKAASITTSARIASRLLGEVQQSNWSTLSDWTNKDVFFDDQGIECIGTKTNAVYTARVKLGVTAGVTMVTSGSVPANQWQRQVMVLVASRPGTQGTQSLNAAEASLDAGGPVPRGVRVSRTLLVNMEKASLSGMAVN